MTHLEEFGQNLKNSPNIMTTTIKADNHIIITDKIAFITHNQSKAEVKVDSGIYSYIDSTQQVSESYTITFVEGATLKIVDDVEVIRTYLADLEAS